jgi:superfamily II DNA or RNA helicase
MKTLYEFQKRLVEDAQEALRQDGIVVMAGPPGSGKTLMGQTVATAHIKSTPNAKVLWLAHGQNNLLDQTFDRFLEDPREFSYATLGPGSRHVEPWTTTPTAGPNPSANLHLSLPHAFVKKNSAKGYTMIVVDEAHHFVEGSMVKGIRAANPKAKVLLLTGTPNKYLISKEAPVVTVSMAEIIRENPGVYADLNVELVQTGANLSLADWDANQRLKPESVDADTLEALQEVVGLLVQRCTSRLRDPAVYAAWWAQFLKGFGIAKWLLKTKIAPTIWACHDQKQAKLVGQKLTDLGLEVRVSTSDTDPDSLFFSEFREKPNGILVVVDRGVLGTDIPELKNVVDMTGSHNVDMTFQLMSRVVRFDKADTTPKLFLKVTPRKVAFVTHTVMAYVLAMSTPEVYSLPHGKIPREDFPVHRKHREIGERIRAETKKNPNKIPNIDLPEFLTLKDLAHLDTAPAASYAHGSIAYAIEVLGGTVLREWKAWTLEAVRAEALKYKTRGEFAKGSPNAYRAAMYNDWRDDVCLHMAMQHRSWDLESIQAEALKYKTRRAFQQGSQSAYNAAKLRGLHDKVCAHMPRVLTYWDIGSCQAEALKYKTRGEFAKGSSGAYQAAAKNGWLDKVCAHITRVQRPWGPKSVRAEAAKYKTRTEFAKGSSGAYHVATKNGWLDEFFPAKK